MIYHSAFPLGDRSFLVKGTVVVHSLRMIWRTSSLLTDFIFLYPGSENHARCFLFFQCLVVFARLASGYVRFLWRSFFQCAFPSAPCSCVLPRKRCCCCSWKALVVFTSGDGKKCFLPFRAASLVAALLLRRCGCQYVTGGNGWSRYFPCVRSSCVKTNEINERQMKHSLS